MAYTRVFKATRLKANVVGCLLASGTDFQTEAVDRLELTIGGIAGGLHHGVTRPAGGREPWYPRGTEMSNDRQVTLVSPRDLAVIAKELDVETVRPEWLGANLVLEGIPQLSMLPGGSLLMFEGGVTLKISGQNAPCRFAGAKVLQNYPDRAGLDLEFVKAAKRSRGLTAWVERAGTIKPGTAVDVRIPEQWIYQIDEMAAAEDQTMQDLFAEA